MDHEIHPTRINPDCVRVRIAPQGVPPRDSALNRYGFLMEEAARRDGAPRLQLTSGDGTEYVLEGRDERGGLLFRLKRIDFAPRRAVAEFELFDAAEDWAGFGDQTRERLFHRGHRVRCEVSNVSSYIPVPFFMSTRGYAILVNTTCRTIFDMGAAAPDKFGWADASGRIDFYVMRGASFKELLARYLELTGRPELPPKWSFGLWYIGRTQADDTEIMNDARLFREYGIPCDVMGLEPGWMEEIYDFSTDKAWSKERFPLPDWQKKCDHTFIKALKRMGYHLELWLCCDYDLSYEEERRAGAVREERQERQLPLCEEENRTAAARELETPGTGSFCDEADLDTHFSAPLLADKLTKPEEAWFHHLEKFVDWGADFFKQDGANQVCFHPDRLWKGAEMHDDEMHNLYPLLYARQMNEGFRKYTGRRPLVFTVAGWTGFQHYCGTWTGDTGGRIETLGAMLNTALVGHSFCTNDMEVAQPEGVHFGYLLPWSQINSWTYFRMPWLQGAKLLAMHQDYARLRSRLIPYLYSSAYQSCRSGVPMLLPLMLEFPDDAACREIRHEYLLGRDLLVTVYKHDLHLPEGSWRDLWTGREYAAGELRDFRWPENRGGGLFLRSGAIVPLKPVSNYVGETADDTIELLLYPGSAEHSRTVLYDDDGVSFAYRDGDFTETELSFERKGDTLTVRIGPDARCKVRNWSLTLCIPAAPARIANNGTAAEGSFDAERGELRIARVEPGEVVLTF